MTASIIHAKSNSRAVGRVSFLAVARRSAKHPRCRGGLIARSAGYINAANNGGILQLPLTQKLTESELVSVFGYDRDLHGKYTVGKVIGAGSFGVVREAVQRDTNMKFAVKSVPKVPKRGSPTPRYLFKLRQEVEAMEQLGACLDAVHLADVFEDATDVHIVMERCQGTALTDAMTTGVLATERDIAVAVASILRFLAQCHGQGIVYRDVKPSNFLFVRNSPASPIKATDFGLSVWHSENASPLTSRSGTPAYMAPEVISRSYGKQADVWSVGILAYQMLARRFPFGDNVTRAEIEEVWKVILAESERIKDYVDVLEGYVSPEAKEFLRLVLVKDPSQRVSAAQALQLPWVKNAMVWSTQHPLNGSVVQRLQRFATYRSLKQQVLRILIDDIALASDDARSKAEMDKVRTLFVALDADRDGFVDSQDLLRGLQAFGYRVDAAEVEHLLTRMDLDQDGRLDFSDIAASLLDWQQFKVGKDWNARLERVFNRLDIYHSGFVEVHEIMQYVPAFDPMCASGDVTAGMASEMLARMRSAGGVIWPADSDGSGIGISREEFFDILEDTPELDSLAIYDTRLIIDVAAGTGAAAAGGAQVAHSRVAPR